VSLLKSNEDLSTDFPIYFHQVSTPATGCQLLPPGVNSCLWVSTQLQLTNISTYLSKNKYL